MAASTRNNETEERAGAVRRRIRRCAALAFVFCLAGGVRSDAATETSVGSAIAAAASSGAAQRHGTARSASPQRPIQRAAPARPPAGAGGQSRLGLFGANPVLDAAPASVALYHFKPALPTEGPGGELYISDNAARFSDARGLMRLERGPVLTQAQGDWLSGMTAFRVVNWDAYRAANPTGPCWNNPVRWIGVRRSPSKVGETAGGPLFAGDIDVAVFSEPDIRRYRQDSPTLCSMSTYRLADAPAPRPVVKTARKAAGKKAAKAKKPSAKKKTTQTVKKKPTKTTKRKPRHGT